MKRLLLALLIVAALPLLTVTAQTEDLPQTYISPDNTFSIAYPADWVIEEPQAGVIYFKSDAEVDANASDLPAGQRIVGVLLPSVFTNPLADTSLSTDPVELVTSISNTAPIEFNPLVEETVNGYPAARTTSTRDAELILAVAYPVGTIVILAQTGSGELTEFLPTFEAMLASLQLSYAALDASGTLSQWAVSASASSEFSNPGWSAMQATGAPNTLECGDIVTAWASSSAQGQDTLTLEFEFPVMPSQINVHQTYNPGAIVAVSVTTVEGETIRLADSADPVGNTACPGVFTLDIAEELPGAVQSVTLSFDQTLTGNWNEIDAVQLIGTPVGDVTGAILLDAPDSEEASEATEEASTPADGLTTHANLTFALPEGWVTELDGDNFYAGTSAEAIQAVIDGTAVPAGEVALNIGAPEDLAELFGPDITTPADALTELNTIIGSTGAVERYPGTNFDAVISFTAGSDAVADGYALIILAHPDGLVGVIVGAGDGYEAVSAQINDFINSIE